MKKISSCKAIQNISNTYSTDNCNCICHYQDDIETNENHDSNIQQIDIFRTYIQSPFKKNSNKNMNSDSF